MVVATSNWAPDQLYQDGLQRHLFLPFIALLKEKLDILALDGGIDYRRERLHGHNWRVVVSVAGERLDLRPTGIRQPQELRGLVEGFAHRVVDGGAV